MQEKEITAAEWMFKQITNPENKLTWGEILEQSKELHKSQIEVAYIQGKFDIDNISGEVYYNNNF